MAQLTIYLPDDVEKEVRRSARREHKTVSAYLADLARKKQGPKGKSRWNQALSRLAGSWEGRFPVIEDLPPEEP